MVNHLSAFKFSPQDVFSNTYMNAHSPFSISRMSCYISCFLKSIGFLKGYFILSQITRSIYIGAYLPTKKSPDTRLSNIRFPTFLTSSLNSIASRFRITSLTSFVLIRNEFSTIHAFFTPTIRIFLCAAWRTHSVILGMGFFPIAYLTNHSISLKENSCLGNRCCLSKRPNRSNSRKLYQVFQLA